MTSGRGNPRRARVRFVRQLKVCSPHIASATELYKPNTPDSKACCSRFDGFRPYRHVKHQARKDHSLKNGNPRGSRQLRITVNTLPTAAKLLACLSQSLADLSLKFPTTGVNGTQMFVTRDHPAQKMSPSSRERTGITGSA